MTRIDLGRLGVPGVIGVALGLFCISFGLATVLPAQHELQRLRKAEAQLADKAAHISVPAGPRSSAAPVLVPALASATKVLEQFTAAGRKFNLPMDQAFFRFTREEGSARYEVSLTLKTNYTTLRGFLEEVMALSPAATLDELTLRRPNAMEPLVEANIRLNFHFDGS